jgi:hypothetical protein
MHRFLCLAILLSCSVRTHILAAEPLPSIPPIARVLPPVGLELPQAERTKLESRLAAIEKRLKPFLASSNTEDDKIYSPDIQIFTKAVRFAIDLQEFYDLKKDLPKAYKLLDEAESRIAEIEKLKAPNIVGPTPSWFSKGRFVVLGLRSHIDQSVQPYGVVFPKNFDFAKLHPDKPLELPVYIWLHGRGDKATDMHFIYERMTQVGQFGEVDGIVIHPFGRQCVGYKSAGEEAITDTIVDFCWDRAGRDEKFPLVLNKRLALVGFSMGGAGAWLYGSHQAQGAVMFRVISPGAGFAETAQYTKTDPATVPWYERKLWSCNDVPCYTRNLFNTQVIAYNGENDKQIQAARVMEDAFHKEGRKLKHLIGPGVAHAYEPKTLVELKREINELLQAEREEKRTDTCSERTHLQTRTLAYSYGIDATLFGLEKHWEDTRLDTVFQKETGTLEVTTKNVAEFGLQTGASEPQKLYRSIIIDGQTFKPPLRVYGEPDKFGLRAETVYERDYFQKDKGVWKRVNFFPEGHKRPGCQGPIDDAFVHPFLVVAPTGKSKNPLVQRWVEFEMNHFIERWRSLMRGNVQIKNDTEVT